ncbi:titin homolog isoform X2 [Silurus meridionalis]|uniref:titin homolog isoform X2 n=1 Tax=Silurus meridionalis TaxID=175797 RepID=UPI001EECB0E6|nr:titin homolog isoform X2 [Silurus meridionalis]
MTSRRTMTHSYSGNGRYGSQNGDDVPSPRLDSRNYISSVRPENRSTFCTVMSQLTEETQPCFETTIKSKAVSEACNVKFTCVVTGYPVPELTWYKDDMELDRYCGLPKYEIFRNGKIHMLHIYNCTVDDAAIYQASARNSKGIVSCSGVLEVGTMSEYKIHQKFFAKLKQKAELKRRELEHNYRHEKDNILPEQLSSGQNIVKWIDGLVPNSSSIQDGEDNEVKDMEITDEQPKETNEELNGLLVKVQKNPMRSEDPSKENDGHIHMSSDVSQKNGNQQLIQSSEMAEFIGITPSTKEKVERNIITISNGFDETFTTKSSQDTGDGMDPHEVMSLAKMLADSLQLQFDGHQQTTFQSQEIKNTNISTIQERKREKEVIKEGETMKCESVKNKEWERWCEEDHEGSLENVQDNVKQLKPEHRGDAVSEAKTSVYKETEYQPKSALSSVFHSLKDIFFGKSKKSPEIKDSSKKVSDKVSVANESMAVNKETGNLLQTQPQNYKTTSAVCGTMPDQLAPTAIIQPKQSEKVYANADFLTETPSLDIKTEIESLNFDNHIHGFTKTYIKASKLISQEEEKAAGPEALQKNIMLTVCEASDEHTEPTSDEHMVQVCHETAGQECTAPTDQRMQDGEEIQVVKEKVDTTDFSVIATASMPHLNSSDLESCNSCSEAQITSVNQATLLVPKKCVHKNGIRLNEKIPECNLNIGSKNKQDMAIAESRDSSKNSETDTVGVTKSPQCNAISENKSTPVLDTSHGESFIMQSKTTQNRNSVLVLNRIMENVQESSAGSGRHNTNKLETIIGNKGNTFYSLKKNTQKHDENREKKMVNETEQRGDSKGGSTKLISEQDIEICKYKKEAEIEGLESLKAVEKTKFYTKVQPERHTVDLRDQSLVSPIIILPDTRETVIKNVAKMRTVPCTQEIKVIVPEKVKHEEPFSVPRIDELLTEPHRVTYSLVHEDASMHRDDKPFFLEPTGIASRASNKNIEDNKVMINVEPVDVTSPQHEWFPFDQRTQVKPDNLEAQMVDNEEPTRVSVGWRRGNDNTNIPIISIACADDIIPAQEEEKEFVKCVINDTVNPDSAAHKMHAYSSSLILTTDVESSTENSMKKEIVPESLAIIFREVVGHSDSEGTKKDTLVETKLNSDVSLALSPKAQNAIAYDTDNLNKESKVEPDADRFQKDKPAMEKLGLTTPVGPTLPPLSPASLHRLMAKNNPNLESQGSTVSILGNGSQRKGEESGGSTPTSTLSCESSPKMKRRDSLTLIPSATPEELASGARRKIYLAKTKSEDEGSDTQSKKDGPYLSPSQARRAAFLQLQSGQQAQQMEKRSPLLGRRKTMLELHKPKEEPSEEINMSNTESKPSEKERIDPYKAPQVIRKIRGEPFSDALGHLKLWCQFFNVLSDSTIKWFKDDVEIAEIKRSAGDENQVALAIVQASSRDCGVYSCTIKNEYGTDTTDYLLSSDILAEFFLRDDSEVGEEIEMTPLLFTKGLVDPGYWGNKFFGRIMIEELQIGEGCAHKNSRAKVIYGLDPVFESGSTCIVKVRNHIVYGTNEENCLAEINLEITRQECKIHNTVREYCKIFAAEARVIDQFGFALEVIPSYLIYRPANSIPYATMEVDLKGMYVKYCTIDSAGRLVTRTTSEVEQKCCTFQHWIYQWTSGNLLVTQIEGVDTKITGVKIATKSKGYQSLTDEGSPKILEQFVIQHQCNYYCGLLGLRALMSMDCSQQSKLKTSRSPLLARKVVHTDSSSPQLLKKFQSSPQTVKKVNSSPKVVRKPNEDEENNSAIKH